MTPFGKELLFPRQRLATSFGRGDAECAVKVFLHSYQQLSEAGFRYRTLHARSSAK